MGQTAKIPILVPPDFSRSKMHNRTLKAVYRGTPGRPRGEPWSPGSGRGRGVGSWGAAGRGRAGSGARSPGSGAGLLGTGLRPGWDRSQGALPGSLRGQEKGSKTGSKEGSKWGLNGVKKGVNFIII